MNIVFVLRGYPTPEDPYQPFSRTLIASLARLGAACTVIAPQSVTRALVHRVPVRPVRWLDPVEGGAAIEVLQPRYLSFSEALPWLEKLTQMAAAKRAIRMLTAAPDVVYGHFWDRASLAARLFPEKPIFVGCGEAFLERIFNRVPPKEMAWLQERLRGAIYVSSQNFLEAERLGLQGDTPALVAPNGYDPALFAPADRLAARRALSLPEEAFIVAFVGAFEERKGVLRVVEAAEKSGAKLLLLGKGSQEPRSDAILFSGSVPHGALAQYLNAADAFCLPSLAEGCSNAIVEAMACGKAIVTSALPFNQDILDQSSAILLEPTDVEAIAAALKKLRDDPALRQKLGSAARTRAEELTIEKRAERILAFMKQNGDLL